MPSTSEPSKVLVIRRKKKEDTDEERSEHECSHLSWKSWADNILQLFKEASNHGTMTEGQKANIITYRIVLLMKQCNNAKEDRRDVQAQITGLTRQFSKLQMKFFEQETALSDAKLDARGYKNQNINNKILAQAHFSQSNKNREAWWQQVKATEKLEREMEDRKQKVLELENALQVSEEERVKCQEELKLLHEIRTTSFGETEGLKQQMTEISKDKGVEHELGSIQETSVENANKSIAVLQQIIRSQDEEREELQARIKSLEKVEKALKARDRKVAELTETIAAKDKKYDDLERVIKSRERDVKVREDKVKNREEEMKDQQRRSTNESSKESGKELKMAKGQWEKEKRAANENIACLEGELKSVRDTHEILKLDFDAVNSELNKAKAKAAEHTSEKAAKEELRKLRKERDEFKGLYEVNRSTEKIIQDRITKAVRTAESIQNTTFEAWKARIQQVAQETDQKLQAAELRADTAELKIRETSIAAEARISDIVKDADERIKDLSRAKVGLLAENAEKDQEIERLMQQLAAMSSLKAET